MRLADLSLEFVKNYLRQDSEDDDALITAMMESAIGVVLTHTGQTLEVLNEQEDVVMAVLVLISNFYDNRTIAVTDKLNTRTNEIVSILLNHHSINLLGGD